MIALAVALLLQVDQKKIDAAVDKGAKYLLEHKAVPVKHPFEGEFAYLWLRMEDPDPAFGSKLTLPAKAPAR